MLGTWEMNTGLMVIYHYILLGLVLPQVVRVGGYSATIKGVKIWLPWSL